ncbi:MAG: hypothetical protein FJX75_01760 [Armatimonadetes bacterium]|nr:hypothetical protein [Armatimonadota bacterium]
MREDKHLTVLRALTEATRKGRVKWKPLSASDWDEFVAVLPDRQAFTLRGGAEGRLWDLELSDPGGEVLDRIHAKPRTGVQELDAAMGELVAAVQAATEPDLDKTISVLQELAK